MDVPSATLVAKRCWVAGRVQGVFYRKSTQIEADKLNLRGYAKNLPDGRVEVLIVGSRSQVELLEKWLWRGSPTSRVTQVDVQEVELSELRELPAKFTTALL